MLVPNVENIFFPKLHSMESTYKKKIDIKSNLVIKVNSVKIVGASKIQNFTC